MALSGDRVLGLDVWVRGMQEQVARPSVLSELLPVIPTDEPAEIRWPARTDAEIDAELVGEWSDDDELLWEFWED